MHYLLEFIDSGGGAIASDQVEHPSDVKAVVDAVERLKANPAYSAVRITTSGVEVARFTREDA